MALTFVASPFYVRQAMAAFAAVDRSLLDASRTLGASEARGFLRVMIPVAVPGLAAGTALALGRALGEFGATLMFAGSFQGITQTVPLAIYDRFSTDFDSALALSAVLVAVSAAILLSVKLCSAATRSPAGRPSDAQVLRVQARTRRGDLELDVELAVESGRCLALAGPSGAGKTSILRVAAGLLRPAHGRVDANGTTWLDTERDIDVPAERRRCGYVFQDYALFPHLSAWQNVAYPLRGTVARRAPGAGARSARAVRPRGSRRRAAAHAERRRAPAGGCGAGARAAAGRAAARRAAIRARRAHARRRGPRARRRCSARATRPRSS